MINHWRGDYREIVTRTGRLVGHGDLGLAERAEQFLNDWVPLSAPVIDVVAERIAALDAVPSRDGLPAWAIAYSADLPGLRPGVMMLADLGDERALPLLLATLRWPQRPRDTHRLLSRYPGHTDRILAEVKRHAPDELPDVRRSFGLPGGEDVARLLEGPRNFRWTRRLGRLGSAAAVAVPALRQVAAGEDAQAAVGAASALWRIDRSPDALHLLTVRLDGPAGTDALEDLAAMGPSAAPAAPQVATYLDAPPERNWWKPTLAALALWRLTGEVERVAPVLTNAWHGNKHTRTRIAEAATGPLAAALAPLFRAEIGSNARHNVVEDGWSSAQVRDDERLLALCRQTLGSGWPPSRMPATTTRATGSAGTSGTGASGG